MRCSLCVLQQVYYTMVSAFEMGHGQFLEKGTHTLQLAAALALGIVAVTTVTSVIYKVRDYSKRIKQ